MRTMINEDNDVSQVECRFGGEGLDGEEGAVHERNNSSTTPSVQGHTESHPHIIHFGRVFNDQMFVREWLIECQ